MSGSARVRGVASACFVAVALLIGLAGDGAAAHDGLRRSVPAAGAVLDVAPREIRLTFTRAVDPTLARIELIDPSGRAVELAAPVPHPDSGNVLVAAVTGRLRAGAYTVRWRIVGSDGHPVQGSFGFVISEGATGLAATDSDDESSGETAVAAGAGTQEGADSESGGPGVAPASEQASSEVATRRSFGVSSPTYVAIRWFTFLCLIGLIGCVAFRLLVLGTVARRGGEVTVVVAPAAERARVIGLALGLALLVAGILRLAAQVYAVGGFEGDVVRNLLTGTAWGRGWILQVAATVLALVGLRSAEGAGARVGWGAAAAAALVLAVTPALSGHAVAAQGTAGLAIVADALHVIGAGGWLGTLAMIVAAGIPSAIGLEPSLRGPAVAALIRVFSPAALVFAGVLAATGLYASALHLGSVAALFETAYGTALLFKLAAIAVVAGLGAYNLFRVKPALGDDTGIAKLRRSSTAELVAASIVLIATALLVATPPAVEAPAAEEQASEIAAPVGATGEKSAPSTGS